MGRIIIDEAHKRMEQCSKERWAQLPKRFRFKTWFKAKIYPRHQPSLEELFG